MNILVGCEESQTVTKAFRAMGHTAFSCDLQECSGGHPEWHIQKDVFGREQRLHYLSPSKDRAKLRSKTYQGIADAMASQWGEQR